MPRNITLCFVEGEPALYLRKSKSYHLLSYNYDDLLEIVKSELIKRDFKTRPQFIIILNILSEQFKCSEGYTPNLNKKKTINPDCFESLFSKDISAFLDTLFIRGLTPEEKIAKENAKIEKRKKQQTLENAFEARYKRLKRSRRIK